MTANSATTSAAAMDTTTLTSTNRDTPRTDSIRVKWVVNLSSSLSGAQDSLLAKGPNFLP